MTHRKKLQVAVASLFIAALCLAPIASASDSGSGSYAAGIFSLDGMSWLEAAWNWLTGDAGQDDQAPARTLDNAVDYNGFGNIQPDGGGMNSTNGSGGGEAGPGIDPDGKE